MAVEFDIAEGTDRIDFDRVHGWLKDAYWSPGISRERIIKAARHSSLVVGAFIEGRQVGYLRVVSDQTRFAYLCDVFVDESFRKRGIAKAMVRYALSHPDHQGLRRWMLATKDAHELYLECGFIPLPEPARWMIRLGDNEKGVPEKGH